MSKRGGDLRAPGCDSALDLVEAILEVTQDSNGSTSQAKLKDEIHEYVHKTISR